MTTPLDYAPASDWTKPGLLARQTLALLTDAVRRLQAAKLFWLSLGLSLLVAAMFGLVGINDAGLTFPIYGQLDQALFNTQFLDADVFYKLLFVGLGVKVWLAWAAIILALISTADLIPSLLADGSADLYLSRPVGRVRLLLTRYVTALLFVAAQSTCFAVASLVVIGLRGGVWVPGVLWAVPMIVLLFSFLYCVSALVGLLTRSPVAAILATLLIWFVSWAVDVSDQGVLGQLMEQRVLVEDLEFDAKANAALQARLGNAGEIARATAAGNGQAITDRLSQRQAEADRWESAHDIIMMVKAPLPKTGETVAVLERRLIAAADLEDLADGFEAESIERSRARAERRERDPNEAADRARARQAGAARAEEAYKERSLGWSLGTSLLLQTVLVGLCCWRFARRDL